MDIFPPKLICIMAEILYYFFKKKISFSLISVLESTVLQYKTKCLNLELSSQLYNIPLRLKPR